MNQLTEPTEPAQILILIGAPASGKGTVSRPLQEQGFVAISTGDLLRAEIIRDTPIGKEIKDILSAGNLASDEIVIGIVKNFIKENPAPGYIFDGFPRSGGQARALDALLSDLNFKPDAIRVVRLDVDDETLMTRVSKRYNEALQQGLAPRSDDNPETFKTRLGKYKIYGQTLSTDYSERLTPVDGNGSADTVLRSVLQIMGIAATPAPAVTPDAQKPPAP